MFELTVPDLYQSHLAYAIMIWFPLLSARSQNSIYLMQKRLIRALSNARLRDHCMPLFKKLGILTVNDLLYRENVLLMFRVVNCIAPVPVLNIFNCGHISTRSTNIVIPKHKLAMINKSFICKAIVDWTSTSAATKASSNKKSLSKQLTKEICSKY